MGAIPLASAKCNIMGMKITLKQGMPEDGYHLVRFDKFSGLHLVLVQTLLDGRKEIVCDTGKSLRFNEFPTHAYWSELILTDFCV